MIKTLSSRIAMSLTKCAEERESGVPTFVIDRLAGIATRGPTRPKMGVAGVAGVAGVPVMGRAAGFFSAVAIC